MSTTSSKRERQKARRAERLAEEQAEERRAGMRNRLVTVIGAVVALAVVVGVGILLVQGSDASLGVPAATADDDVVLPDIPQAGADPAIGTEAPVVVGYEPDGTALAIGGEGAPQAVVFMAATARCTADSSASELASSNRKPVPLSQRASQSTTVSTNPPVARAIGGAPYRCAIC